MSPTSPPRLRLPETEDYWSWVGEMAYRPPPPPRFKVGDVVRFKWWRSNNFVVVGVRNDDFVKSAYKVGIREGVWYGEEALELITIDTEL